MGSSGDAWKLKDHPKLPKGKTVAVIVLDGWGEAKPNEYNAISVAETPVMDSLKKGAPEHWRLIKAHGGAVGLPTEDDMGNSEVGHNALGAGRIFAQGAKLVDLALASGKIYDGEGFKYIKECFDKGTLHLIGLLSDGGVHSRLDQLLLLLKGAAAHGAKRIRVHALTDGRDVLDGSSVGFMETLENDLAKLREQGVDAQVASGGGRMYVTMDRYENDWDVVKRGWDAQVLGEAPHKFKDPVEAIKKLRQEPNANDQYLAPFVIVDDNGKPVGPILDGDAVVTFNFRADRMVMLAKALEYENFDKFDRVRVPKIHYAGMLQYDGELKLPSKYLVSPPEIDRTSGEYLVHNGIRTFACSETVKFGHVTFFWNGNRSGYFNEKLEEYVEIQSDIGITFNVKPKMKALTASKMTTSFGTTATATATPAAAASTAVFPGKDAPKSLTLLPFCHRRHYNPLHSKLSITPKLRFFCKGLHSSWNHSAVARAQLNEVALGGSSNDAVTPTSQSEEVKSPSETSSATSVSEEAISNFISQVSSLVKLVDSRDVVELQLKQLDCEILIRKKEALPQPPSPAPVQAPVMQSYHAPSVQYSAPPPPSPAPPIQTPAPSPAAAKSADSSLPPLKSPMAGTFYRSPAPGEPAFVKVGDKVQKGQVLCIIEAMKLMNEIEADRSGTIVEVIAEDGKPVSVDSPLFVIKP